MTLGEWLVLGLCACWAAGELSAGLPRRSRRYVPPVDRRRGATRRS